MTAPFPTRKQEAWRYADLDALKPIVSAVLAVLLWPLVLFGINLHLK